MEISGWDIALLFAAGYVAVTALVRLMLRRRDQLVAQARKQAEAQRGEAESPPLGRRSA